MDSNSPNTFQSQGNWYTLNIVIVPDVQSFPEDTPVSLDANGIEEFSYTSELNSLVLTGKVRYVDDYGYLDKFLEQQQMMCQVTFVQNKSDKDGKITDTQIDKEKAFMHEFIVTSMKIVDRKHSHITYEIGLVSSHWYQCIANIEYSNNDREQESLFDILKACMRSVQLKVNDSFKRVRTKVEMDYSSQANDNLFKVFYYLLDKLYFWPDKDNALKFLVYNWYKDEYGLLDITDKETFTGTSATVLSFFKSNAEQLVQQNESNIGSYSNGKDNSDIFKSMFNRRVYQYDFEQNAFKADTSSDSKALANFMNNHVSYDDYQLKYHQIEAFSNGIKHIDNASYWNMPLNVYFNVVDTMYAAGAITLNTYGEILRQCGSLVSLVVDRDMNALTDDSSQSMKDLKTKFIGFEGAWLALKVVTIICPRQSLFRQKIALFRNYTKRDKPPEEVVL